MPLIVEGIYEHGVVKLPKNVNIKEGEKVQVIVKENITESTKGILKGVEMKEIIEEIENEGIFDSNIFLFHYFSFSSFWRKGKRNNSNKDGRRW